MAPRLVQRLLLAVAFLLPLGFAAFTQHAWEDYFITLRASRNLVEGHGLVFTPGERVHSFTSPLGTLLPALCTAIVGVGREEAALWLFRLISAAFLAGAAGLLWRRLDTLRVGPLGRFIIFGFILADAKLTDFAINGMETALLAWFVVLLWSELEAPTGPRISGLALAYGGLMWTRPDAFILAGAITLPHLLLGRRTAEATPIPWRSLLRGALFGGLLYVPWFAWAWWYYGSPIPHTIVAKSAFAPPFQISNFVDLSVRAIIGPTPLTDLFLPAYWVFGGWPSALPKLAHGLAVIVSLSWLIPRFSLAGRRLSLALFLGLFYLGSITLYPWYVPPWLVVAALTLGLAGDQLYATFASRKRWLAPTLRITAGVLVALQVGLWLAVAWQMRVQQRLVEDGVRRQVGEWLRVTAKAGDTLFLEPLGYIGYFSQMKTYDFPGLSSREVVREVRAGAGNYAMIIDRLRPDWLVLRPFELAEPQFAQTDVLVPYQLATIVTARRDIETIPFLPGRRWNLWESEYLIYRRRTPINAVTKAAAAP